MSDTDTLLRDILYSAYMYDDKPHRLYSSIMTAAKQYVGEMDEKQREEIRRLMDVEYQRPYRATPKYPNIHDAYAEYNRLRDMVFAHVGYVEDWRVLPLEDSRKEYWQLVLGSTVDGYEAVRFHEDAQVLLDPNGYKDYYENEVYHQRFLPKWVYRGADLTMVVVDTHVDGNQFLQVFDNRNEIKDTEYDH